MSTQPGVQGSPYKGLMPYSEEDAAFFFGREDERDIISANLQASRLTLVYGGSGVGKSSLLRAGVAHQLREIAKRDLEEGRKCEVLVVVFSSWRDDPMTSLIDRIHDSITQTLGSDALKEIAHTRSLVETLERCSSYIEADLLVILDQFEEYFLYHPQEDGEGTFAVEFPRAVMRPGLRANFLISIREDAVAKLDSFKGRIPNLFHNYLRVEHLDREAARDAVELPLGEFNRVSPPGTPPVSIEPALTDAVLDQVRTGLVVLGEVGKGDAGTEDRIETPYLQLVMSRLWNEEMKTGSRVLRLATLNRLQGAERIVRTHLDEVMSALSPGEQEIAARTFRYLVTSSGTKIAHATSDLADYAEVPQDQLEPILEKLSSGPVRILRPVASSSGKPGGSRYEIFHDVLAPAILDWRQRVETRRRFEVERGLKPLHKKLWKAGGYFLAANLVLTAPLLLAMIEDPESPQFLLPWWFVGAVTILGFLVMLGVCAHLIAIYRNMRRAMRLGFRWSTVVEVLSDRRGDVGALIAGADDYQYLDSNWRRRIRTIRCLNAIAMLLIGALPLFGLAGVVALGSRRLLDPSNILSLVSAPILVLLVAVFISDTWQNTVRIRAVHRPNAHGGAQPARSRAVQPTFEVFEGIVPDRPFGASTGHTPRAFWVLPAGIVVFVFTAALVTLPLVWVLVVGSIETQLAVPPIQRTEQRIRLAQVGRPLRLPANPAISAVQAGKAYYTLAAVGRAEQQLPYEYPVPRRIEEHWLPNRDNNPLGKDLSAVFETLLIRAVRGFSEQESQYLERVAAHPGFAEYSTAARATEMDYLGARFKTLRSAGLWTLPVTGLAEMRDSAYAHVAKAALELYHGRRTESEIALRETISVGLLMVDESPLLFDTLAGTRNVEIGLKALENFYSVTGQDAKAATIRTARDAAATSPEDTTPTKPVISGADIADVRRTMMKIVQDPKRARGERWDYLLFLTVLRCANAREVVFGPHQELETTFDKARQTLVRFPMEQELFDRVRSLRGLPFEANLSENASLLERIFIRTAALSGRVFHNERIGSCVEMQLLLPYL